PTRFHEEGPAVRARTVDGRLVMSIDVTAAPERIRSDFWSELARQMSIRGALTPHVADRAAYLENRAVGAGSAILGQGIGAVLAHGVAAFEGAGPRDAAHQHVENVVGRRYEPVRDLESIADRLREDGPGATALVRTVHADGDRHWVIANRDGTLRAVEVRPE